MDCMAYLVSSSMSEAEKNRRPAMEIDRLQVPVPSNYHFLPATPRTSTEVICSSPIRFDIEEDSFPRYSESYSTSAFSGSSSFESGFSRQSTFSSAKSAASSSSTSSSGKRKKRRSLSWGWTWKIWSPLKNLQMSI